jgi:hypothetical protein
MNLLRASANRLNRPGGNVTGVTFIGVVTSRAIENRAITMTLGE